MDFRAPSAPPNSPPGVRRGTHTPFDQGEADDIAYTTGAFADLQSAGRLELQTSYRNRQNPYVLG